MNWKQWLVTHQSGIDFGDDTIDLMKQAYVAGLRIALGLLYQSVVKSTAQLRNDLHNRKLLAEFEAWLKERDKGKILSKDE
jgi:hypothetical protein